MTKYLSLIILSVLFISSCTNSFNFSSADSLSQANEHLEEIAQYANFNSTDGVYTFTSEEEVNILIDPDFLLLNGEPVSGEIQIKFIEIFDKGTMLITDKHTMGLTRQGDLEILKSAGTFFIELTANGEPLDLAEDGVLEFRYKSKFEDDILPEMDLFKSTTIEDNSFWTRTSVGDMGVYEDQENLEYIFYTNFTNWINCDYFLEDLRPMTEIEVLGPSSMEENSRIYLSFDGLETGLANNYGKFPVGQEVHIIAVQEKKGRYDIAIKSTIIEENMTVTFEKNEFEKITKEELISEINELP